MTETDDKASADKASGRDRLLRHLGEPGAFAMASPLGCGRLALFRTKLGTSLGAGYMPLDVAEALLSEGLVHWSGTGRGRRLTAAAGTAPGRKLASRDMHVDGAVQPVLYDERESPLLWLHRRAGKDGKPQISTEEFAAGERFRADLTLAQMLPRTTMNWDASASLAQHGAGERGPAAASDSSLAARQRVRLACDRLGPAMSGLAIDVCGFLKGLDQVERERGWPARSAKVVLRLALSVLVAHYGIATYLQPARRRSAWQADGARPGIVPAARDA